MDPNLENFQDLIRRLQETEEEKRRLNEQTLAYKAELDEKAPILAEMQEEVKKYLTLCHNFHQFWLRLIQISRLYELNVKDRN